MTLRGRELPVGVRTSGWGLKLVRRILYVRIINMDLITVILAIIGFHVVSLSYCRCFLIGSFNVQIFGQKKSNNTEVVHILTQVSFIVHGGSLCTS